MKAIYFKRLVFASFSILISMQLIGQQRPADENTKKILIKNATAHIGNGKTIKRSLVAIEGQTISFVKDALTSTIDETSFDTIIEAKDQHIYPGFIAPNSTLGLTEIDAVRASRDARETGTINPNVRSIVAYNAESKITTTVRTNGVLVGQIVPRGGLVSGTSSVVHFDAWNWEDAIYKEDDGLHINWPNSIQKSGWWAEPGPAKKSSKYSERMEQIENLFKEAIAYHGQKQEHDLDLRLEAMKGVIEGTANLYIHASLYKEINDLINFKKEFKIQNIVIVGGYDAHLHAKRLNENDISVILQRVHSLPERPEDDVNHCYKLANILHQEEVLFCFQNSGDMERMGTRNLPFYAGTAVAFGLPYEKAIQALTLNAAKILGVDKKIGSIEKGKDATLFISSGDALDMRANKITYALIQGRSISLSNHQIENYEKFKGKYGLK